MKQTKLLYLFIVLSEVGALELGAMNKSVFLDGFLFSSITSKFNQARSNKLYDPYPINQGNKDPELFLMHLSWLGGERIIFTNMNTLQEKNFNFILKTPKKYQKNKILSL